MTLGTSLKGIGELFTRTATAPTRGSHPALRRCAEAAARRPLGRHAACCLTELLEGRRLLSAGALDTSFDGDGRAVTDVPGSSNEYAPGLVLAQPDGKTVVVGTSGDYLSSSFGTEQLVLVRYLADGSLDAAFGSGGVAAFGAASTCTPRDVALDQAGRIIVAGYTPSPAGVELVVLRFDADGSADTTFGPDVDGDTVHDGRVVVHSGYFARVDPAVATDGAGGIVFAGSGPGGMLVARLAADGSFDTSFGEDPENDGIRTGRASLDFAHPDDVAVDTAGRIVAVASPYRGATATDFALARLTPDGSPDTTFGPALDGRVFTDFGSRWDFATGVAVDSAGRIIAAGTSSTGGGAAEVALARYNDDGSLDAAFGPDLNGKVRAALSAPLQMYGANAVSGVAVDGTDGIHVAGVASRAGTGAGMFLARYTTAGTLDPAFGQDLDGNTSRDGVSFTGFGLGSQAYTGTAGVALDGSGRIAIGGSFSNTTGLGSGSDFVVTRYAPDGTPDATFGGDGTVTTDRPGVSSNLGEDVAVVQPDGKVIVAANSWDVGARINLVRYNVDGTPDATFGTGGVVAAALGQFGSTVTAITIDSAGRIVLGANVYQANTGRDFGVARFLPDGTADTTFGQDHDGDGARDGWTAVNVDTVTIEQGFGYTRTVTTEDTVSGVAIDSLGRIVVGGYARPDAYPDSAYYTADFAVVRFDPDGTLDTGFGPGADGSGTPDGRVVTDLSETDIAYALAVDAGDRILLAGNTGYDFAVLRYDANGILDGTFGADAAGGAGDGIATANFPGSSYSTATGVVVDRQGRVVVGVETYPNTGDFGVARFNADGTPDTTFGQDLDGNNTPDGKALADFGAEEWVTDVALDPGGRIVVVGGTWGDAGSDFAVARFTAAGALDASFDGDGMTTTDFGSYDDAANAVAVDALGRVVAAGYTTPADASPYDYDIAVARYFGGDLVVEVVPATVAADIQAVVSGLDESTEETLPPVVLSAGSDTIDAVLAAVGSLSVDPAGSVIDVVLNLVDGTYGGQEVNVPAGVRLILRGDDGGETVIVGASPSLTLTSGTLVVEGITFVNSTDAPSILVKGGNLTLRNSTVLETTGGSRAAVEVLAGTVDLGTAADPGGNTFGTSGPGELIRNVSPNSIPALGNAFQADGAALASGFRIEDAVFHALDAGGGGLVTYAAGTVFVTPASGSIQRGVDAVALAGTVHVEAGAYATYHVGPKPLAVAFENGPTLAQQPDAFDAAALTLAVTGTAGGDRIGFAPGANAGDVDASVAGVPTGTFRPTARLVASGGAGDDELQAAGGLTLPAWLDGGDGTDRLKGGAGHDVLLGGEGDDLLVGGSGRDLITGQAGADRLVGNADDDILVADYLIFADDAAALRAVMAEWTSGRDFQARTGNLGNVSPTADRLNGDYFLVSGQTVLADESSDVLTGSAGLDWFFFDQSRDRATDLDDDAFAGDLAWITST